jgi:hypothetical protein
MRRRWLLVPAVAAGVLVPVVAVASLPRPPDVEVPSRVTWMVEPARRLAADAAPIPFLPLRLVELRCFRHDADVFFVFEPAWLPLESLRAYAGASIPVESNLTDRVVGIAAATRTEVDEMFATQPEADCR